MDRIKEVNQFISGERNILLSHPLYTDLKTIDHLCRFTEGHVYAVWDFMSLLKALQIHLTCTTIPWVPSKYPNTRYLINEIVLAEESDQYIDGRRLSHYEMYLDAMTYLGANTDTISSFLQDITKGISLSEALLRLNLDSRICDFLAFTFEIIAEGQPHKIAAAFTFGREDLIPDMFTSLLNEIQFNFPEADLNRIIYYFQRHIELDGDEHGPLAMQMILELAGDDEKRWEEIKAVAKQALQHRILLWDAIRENL